MTILGVSYIDFGQARKLISYHLTWGKNGNRKGYVKGARQN